MTKNNALTLHNYFCNCFKRQYKQEYNHQAKGIELILLKRLLDRYDKYQLMYVIDRLINESISVTIKTVYDSADEWIMEYAYDPLLAKARFAIHNSKGNKDIIKSAMYDYMDENDAWAPSHIRIEKAAEVLRSTLEFLD